jgi:hypothetical protein
MPAEYIEYVFTRLSDHSICIFGWSFVLLHSYTAAVVISATQNSEEQSFFMSLSSVTSPSLLTSDALSDYLLACLGKRSPRSSRPCH